MKAKKTFVIILLLLSIYSYSQTTIININPEIIHQNVVFGGDNKLTIKAWAEGNTNSVSSKLFQDMNLKILRVPIFALQDITDPLYDNVITVINSVKNYNPNVKIFASVANGDGYGIDHHGAPKFPSNWLGCCASNVYNLNLTAYSAYLDSFMEKMNNAGITVDYLGPYNEDPADNSDYSKITSQMTKLGDTKMVGLERWALGTSIADVDELEDQVSIVGSHFYDDETINESNWDSTWASLVEKSEHPVWYTEATRYSTGDNIDLLIAGIDNIFAPIRGGAEAVIFYQVCKRFVYANGSKLPIKYSGFQNIVNNAEGNVIESNSDNSNIKIVVFGSDKTLDIHVINKNTSDSSINLNLLGNFLGNGTVTGKTWAPSITASSFSYNVSNSSSLNITALGTSYSHLKIPLNKSILSTESFTTSNQEIKIYPNPSLNGELNINLPENTHSKEVTIKVFSSNGKEVYSDIQQYKKNISINQNLPSGIYFISMTIGNAVYTTKIIMNNK